MTGSRNVYIDIDQRASEEPAAVDRFICVRTQHFAENENATSPFGGVQKHTVTYNSISGITTTDTVGSPNTHHNVGTGMVDHLSHGTVTEDPAYPGHHIVSVTFAANAFHGYYYSGSPVQSWTSSQNASNWHSYFVVQSSNLVYETDVTSAIYGELIGIQFDVYYTPPTPANGAPLGTYPDPASSATAMCELGASMLFTSPILRAESARPGSKIYITDVTMGSTSYPNSFTNNLPYMGGYRDITVIGDDAASEFFMTITEEDGKTYDFTTDIFTAGATQSANFVIGSTLLKQFTVRFPTTASDTYYDTWITPVSPTQAFHTVPTPPGFQSPNPTQVSPYSFRLQQLDNAVISVGFEDPGNLWGEGTGTGDIFHASDNTKITLTGSPNTDLDGVLTKDFSYTVEPGHLDAGSGTLNPTTKVTDPVIDFTLRGGATVSTQTDGTPSGATFDVNSTTGVAVGDDIVWSIQKTVIFNTDGGNTVTLGSYDADAEDSDADAEDSDVDAGVDLPPNTQNIVVGMVVTGGGAREDRNITVEQVEEEFVVLSETIDVGERGVLTFTANNITVNTVTDTNTLVASQSLAGLTDNLTLTIGGGESNTTAHIKNGTATKVGSNIVIAGQLNVFAFGSGSQELTLDLSKLILIT